MWLWRNADGIIEGNANALKSLRLIAIMLFALSACLIDGTGLVVAPGWTYHSLGAWKNLTPNQIVLSPDGRWLYFGSETSEFTTAAGVVALHASNGRTHVLVQGLENVNGMRFAPDGSLWVAESGDQGEIWRMAEPGHFPDDQRVNALTRESTHPGFRRFALPVGLPTELLHSLPINVLPIWPMLLLAVVCTGLRCALANWMFFTARGAG